MPQMYDPDVDENAEGVIPKFFMKAVPDKEASKAAGSPVYKEVEYIDIKLMGDHTTAFERKVTDKDRQRFADSYRRFKEGKKQKFGTGLPLEEWPAVDSAMVKTLNSLQVYTVEQLAEFPDNFIHKIPMGQTWKQKAKAWLKQREGGATTDLRAEVDELKELLNKTLAENRKLKGRKTRRRKKTTTKTVSTED